MGKVKYVVLFCLIITTSLLWACTQPEPTLTLTSTPEPTATQTSAPKPTSTPLPTPAPAPTPTPMVLPTPLPTGIPLPNIGLDDFVFEGSELPEACSVKKSSSLSSDRELTDQLIALALANDKLAASAVSSLFAVYYEGPEYNEIGYFGLEFESTKSAEQVAAILIQHGQGSAPGRFSVFLVGNIVVEVWRDDEDSIGPADEDSAITELSKHRC